MSKIWFGLLSLMQLALLALAITVTNVPAAQARFLQADTFDPFEEGVDFNRYAYAGNDPINLSDPNGHQVPPRGLIDAYRDANGNPEANERFADLLDQASQWAQGLDFEAGAGKPLSEGIHELAMGFRFLSKLDRLATPAERLPTKVNPSIALLSNSGHLIPSATNTLGKWGEVRLASYLGGKGLKPAKPFATSLGPRYVDRLSEGIAYESKAGLNVRLTTKIQNQINKDAELIRSGQIRGAEWHFWRGASAEVLKALHEAHIRAIVHHR